MYQRRTAFIVFLVLMLVFTSCASGPPGKLYPDSKLLLYSKAPPVETRLLNKTAQIFLEDLGDYFHLPPPPGGLLRIHHFKWRWRLWWYLGSHVPSLRWRKGACFEIPEGYVIAISGNSHTQKTQKTLRHELTHYFLAVYYTHIPPWLDEGLAQVMACGPPFPHIEKELRHTVLSAAKKQTVTACKQLLLLPSGRLLNRTQYHLSCAMVYYLLIRSEDTLPRLLRFLGETDPEKSSQELFSASWGLSIEQACRALPSWAD